MAPNNDSERDDRLSVDDLPDHVIEDVINSTGFQKMLAYRKLADGIQVLEEQDQLFESMVNTITNQHSTVQSEQSVRQFFELFVAEVESFTEGLVEEDDGPEIEVEDLFVEDQ